MKTVTSHVLNGVDGTHASSVPARLINCETGKVLAEAVTDDGGRLVLDVPKEASNTSAVCHLVFDLCDTQLTTFVLFIQFCFLLRCRLVPRGCHPAHVCRAAQ